MKKYFYLAVLAILTACNNQPENNNNVVVVDEMQETKRVIPEFNGTIDSLSLKNMMANYFTIKNALIDGNREAASKTSFGALTQMPKSDDEVLKSISANFKLIGESSDLAKQREYFYPLSELIYSVSIKQKPDTATLFKQYCPMAFDDKGAWWISDEREVVNPYFGEEMLNCGIVQEEY
jgi:hypothetical protein